MVLQIEDDEQLQDVKKVGEFKGCQIFVYYKTIYLNPTNCKLLFFSRQAEVLLNHSCSDSKMSKLVDYFTTKTVEPGRYRLEDLVTGVPYDAEKYPERSSENAYDKVKGFVCGYYIGAVQSLPSDIARMYAIQKRVYDIAVSIKNNDGKRNAIFNEELERLSREYDSLDPDKKEAQRLWKESFTGYRFPEEILKYLKVNKLEGVAKCVFVKQQGLILRTQTITNLQAYSDELKIHIQSLILKSNEKNRKFSIKEQLDLSPDYSNVMMYGSDEGSRLFNSVLQNVLWRGLIPSLDRLRTDRENIATQVVIQLKEIVERNKGQWQDSKEQMYFQHLRENISMFSEFKLTEIDDVVMQSVAAFLLKGEDYDGLMSYLRANAIPTYQYALALWGAVSGYVRIPRTIIHGLMGREMFESFYVDLYSVLYGRTLKGKLEKKEVLMPPMPPKPDDYRGGKSETMQKGSNKGRFGISGSVEAAKDTGFDGEKGFVGDPKGKILPKERKIDERNFGNLKMKESCPYERGVAVQKEDYRAEVEQICDDMKSSGILDVEKEHRLKEVLARCNDKNTFLKELHKEKGWKGNSKLYKKMEERLNGQKSSNDRYDKGELQLSFDAPRADYKDENRVMRQEDNIVSCSILRDKKVAAVVRDWIWKRAPRISENVNKLFAKFYKEYNDKDGFYYNKRSQYDRTKNGAVIDHFIRFCFKPWGGVNGLSVEYSEVMDELKQYLMSMYRD